MSNFKHLFFLLFFSFISNLSISQLVSVPFKDGFIGSIGSNTQQADIITKFSTLGISKSAFIQQTQSGLFYTTQGNDIGGTLRFYFTTAKNVTISGVTSTKNYIDIEGAIVWKGPNGGGGDNYFGFLPNPNTNISFNYGSSSTYTISRSSNGTTGSNIGNLRNDRTQTFTDTNNESGNASGVVGDLNNYKTIVQGLDPSGPVTVNSLTTTNKTPTITGTATLASGESLSVTVNGVVYTVGDGNLSISGTNWTLVIPNANILSLATYSVEAIITNASGYTLTDGTSNELIILPPPTITTSGALKTFASCSGCTVTPQSFTVAGADLTNDIVVTAPTGFQVSDNAGASFASSITLTQTSGTLTTTTVYVKLANNATTASSGNITIASTGATSHTITATVNTDNALNFDGSNDFVNIPDNNALDVLNAFTVEAWVNPASSSGSQVIIGKIQDVNTGNAADLAYALRYNSGVLRAEIGDGSGALSITTNGLVTNKWQHIAMVFNGATVSGVTGALTLYIDGVKQGNTLATGYSTLKNVSTSLKFGAYGQYFNQYYIGLLDNVKIWNTAKSQSEIAAGLNTELNGNETGLVAYYNFNHGIAGGTNSSITTIDDRTSNAFTGTLNGFAKTGATSNFISGTIPEITATGNATTLASGSTLQLANPLAGGTWSSTNTSFATVDASTGLVTGVAAGTVTINYTICNKVVNYALSILTPTPTITNNSSITFLENSINTTPGLLYASTSSSYASATPIFTGKTMKIEYVTSGGTSTTGLTEDNLGVRNQGSNAGEVNVTLGSTNTIKVGSTTVGTYPSSLTGSGVSSEYLLITWSGSPTLAQVNAVLNNITYKTSSDVPTLVRYVKLTILDGSSTLTNQMTVNVTRENDAPRAGAINTRSDITANGDPISIYPSGSTFPTSEGVANAIDNSSSTKYLNFSGNSQVTGLVVTPATGATIVTKLTFTSANDAEGRDPLTYKLEGSRDGGSSFTSIVNSGATNLTATRFNKTEGVEFSNTEWYNTYRLTFPTLRAAGNYMQIGEIELLGVPYQRVVYTLGSSPAIVVHNLLPLSDVDNASETITSATVKITTNLSANDVLTWTNQAGIAGSYNSGTGILSFTGSASISTYQTLLRSVKFNTAAPNSALKERLVTFQITDAGGLSSNEAEARVIVTYPPTLTSVNNLGTAIKSQTNNITYTILSNAAQNFTDSDTEDLPLKFKVKSVGSNGTLTKAGSAISVGNIISSGETIVWTPSSNGSNIVIMTVRAFDGDLESASDVNVVMNVQDFQPTITTTGTLTAFTTCAGSASATQTFTVSGANLTNNITLTAPTGYELSTSSGGTFSSSISLTQSGGTINTSTIYVRLTSAASNTASGNISVTSTGATTKTIATGAATVNALPAISGTLTACTSATTILSGSGTPSSSNPWTSSATNIATVSSTGVVTGVAEGSATITFTNSDGCSIASVVSVSGAPADFSITGDQTVCLNNTATYTANGNTNALDFDGSNDYVATASNISALNITSDITLETWLYIDQHAYDWVRLIGKGSGSSRTYGLWLATNGQLLLQFYGSPNSIDLMSNQALSTGRWYHVAAVRNGNSIKIFIDGVETASSTYVGTSSSNTSPLQIGFGNDHTYFNGKMTEVRVWNIARTQSEIANNKDVSIAPQTGLVAYYKFNQGTANGSNASVTTLTDASGNNYHATLSNFDLTGTNSNFVTGRSSSLSGAWASSNTSVATIDANGVVTPVAAGTTNIEFTMTNTAGCSLQKSLAITVPAALVAPTGVDGSRNGIGTVAISATVGSGETVDWYADLTGGTILSGGTGTLSFTTPSISATTTYYAEARNATTGCISTTRTGVIATVETLPVITTTGTLNTFTTCASTASAAQTFTITGNNLTNNITLTAPTGYEMSTTIDGVYSSTISITQVSGVVSATQIFVRLTATAINAAAGNITATSTGATTQTIATGAATVNALPASPTITSSQLNATVCEGAPVILTATAAAVGNAIALNGTNQQINIANGFASTDDLTYEAWVYPTNLDGGSFRTIINHNGWSTGYVHFQFHANRLQFALNGNTDKYSTYTFSNNTWYHVAAVYSKSAGTVKFYVNGAHTNTEVETGITIPAALPYKIGSWSDDRFFGGNMDEIRIWNTARTAAQIAENINISVPASSAGLVAYYKANEASGTTLVDATSNNSNGILINGASWLIPSTSPVTDATNYLWNDPATSSTAAITVSPIANTTYTVTATNANGCASTASITVRIANPAGNFGNALNFDGINDAVLLAANSPAFQNTITIETWVKALNNTNDRNILSWGYALDGVFNWNDNVQLRLSGHKLEWGMHSYSNNVGWQSVTSNKNIDDGVWHHIAIVKDGNTSRMYIDGELEATQTMTHTMTVNRFVIGAAFGGSTNSQFFNGSLDELRIWNAALTLDEIRSRMNRELIGNETNLTALYNFNEGVAGANNTSITTINNSTTNAHNGTIANIAMNGTSSNFVVGPSFVLPEITGNTIIASAGDTAQLSNAIYGGIWSITTNTFATINSTGLLTSTNIGQGTATVTYTLSSSLSCGSLQKSILVTVDPAAIITGPSGNAGDATSTKSINENTTPVFTFTANETVSWSIDGGSDAAKFTLNSSTGALSFITEPDYEIPTDANTNNTYIVIIKAVDAVGNISKQTVTVTVLDVYDNVPPPPTLIGGVYLYGSVIPSLPSFIKSLPPNTIPVWCNTTTNICSETHPATPIEVGRYIYQVRSYDTLSKKYSVGFANDTIIVKPLVPQVRNATYIIGLLTNPTNIAVQVTGVQGSTINYFLNATKQSSTPTLGNTVSVKRYTVSQTVNTIESDTAGFNVTMLNQNDMIHLQKIAETPVLQSNSTFNITYKFIVNNLTAQELTNVLVADNLQNTIPITSEYSILNIRATGGLFANASFNGSSDIYMSTSTSKVAAYAKDTLVFTLNIKPKGFSGVMNNTATIAATTPYGVIAMVSSAVTKDAETTKSPTPITLPDVIIDIPEVFTPNRDGVNDKFVILKPFGTTLNLEIFNRWGNIVYLNTNYNSEWDGRGTNNFIGQDLLDGGYYYNLKATNSNGETKIFKGFVIIQR